MLVRHEGHKVKPLAEFEVTEMDPRDRIAALETKLSYERAKVKELKAHVADLAERCLNLVWEKEQLQLELEQALKVRGD
jgi:regulator of replication initiation timing